MKSKLTGIVLAKNEKKVIERSLKSIHFCDEIIVIDDNSTDKTVQIAKSLGAQVYTRELKGDFAGQRNFGMEKAVGEWILFLDADEVVNNELKDEVLRLTSPDQDDRPKAYHIKRRDFWWGREKKFGETLRARQTGIIRLVKKNSGKWKGAVHEVFETSGFVGRLDGFINHYPHQTVKEFLEDINLYSSDRAAQLKRNGYKTNVLEIVFYPLFKFVLTYFIYLGFLDGSPGFVYSFMMSFHSFLVRAKLYQINHEM